MKHSSSIFLSVAPKLGTTDRNIGRYSCQYIIGRRPITGRYFRENIGYRPISRYISISVHIAIYRQILADLNLSRYTYISISVIGRYNKFSSVALYLKIYFDILIPYSIGPIPGQSLLHPEHTPLERSAFRLVSDGN